MTLDEARKNIGRKIVYWLVGQAPEYGTIHSVNDRYVHVSYGIYLPSVKATRPEDISLWGSVPSEFPL